MHLFISNKAGKLIILALAVLIFQGCEKDDNEDATTAIKDVDGNSYTQITVGTQTWMVENLKTTRYKNGESIPTLTAIALKQTADDVQQKYQVAHGRNQSNATTYGLLYSWYAITDSRGLCPDGWRVPNDQDWKTLETNLGMSQEHANLGGFARGTNEAAKIAGNASLWRSGTLLANADFGKSGMNVLPGGMYNFHNNTFAVLGEDAALWTTSEEQTEYAWFRSIYWNGTTILRGFGSKNDAMAVKCIKE